MHYDEGTPVTGPVRYVLFESAKNPDNIFYLGAEPWPFGDPAEIAVTVEQQESSPSLRSHYVQVAEGDQAAILREFRRRFFCRGNR